MKIKLLLLTDNDTTTCINLEIPTSALNQFKMKIFNAQLCLNISMVTFVTENLCCHETEIVVYSPVEANHAERADFTGYFKEFSIQ